MTRVRFDFATVLRDAWGLFRRDGDLLLRVAGVFLFLPAFALAMLVPDPPLPAETGGDSQAQALAWVDALSAWGGTYGGWYALAYVVGYFGAALVYTLYCDRTRPDVQGAIGRGLRLFPRFLLATILIGIPAGFGLLLWALPGLYILGRTMPLGPLLYAERDVSAVGAIRRSFAMTRGAGLALMGLAAFGYISGWVAEQPFLMLDRWLRAAGGGNPVAVAIVDAGAAGAAMAAGLATALISVAAYRRLAR